MKVIFFDAAGTLIYLPISVGQHYSDVANEFGASLDPATLDRAFKQAWTVAPVRPELINSARKDDDKGWWRDLVYEVLRQTLPLDLAASFDKQGYFEAVYAHFAKPGVWKIYDDVLPTLQALRAQGVGLGIISNFDRRLHLILEHLDLRRFFTAVIVSSEVGAEKPSPAIFQKAMDRLEVTASEAWHVGDDRQKDGGASLLGMHVFHLQRPDRGLNEILHEMGVSG